MAVDLLVGLLLASIGLSFLQWLKRSRRHLASAAVLLTLLVLSGLATSLPTSPFFVGSDAAGYQIWGSKIAESIINSETLNLPTLWPGKGIWPLTIGFLQVLVGQTPFFSLIFLNSLLIVFCAWMTREAAQRFTGIDAPWVVTISYILNAPIMLFGPMGLREAFFWVGASMGVLAIASLRTTAFLRALVCLLGTGLILIGFRPDLGYALWSGLTLAFIFQTVLLNRKGQRLVPAILGACAATTLIVSFLPIMTWLGHPGDGDLTVRSSASRITNSAINSSNGLTKVLPNSAFPETLLLADSESPSLVLIGRAIGNSPRAFFGPFWWELEAAPIWILSGLAAVQFWFLLSTAGVFLLKGGRSRTPTILLLTLAFGLIFLLAATVPVYGILLRFKVVAAILLLPASAGGILVLSKTISSRNVVQMDGNYFRSSLARGRFGSL